MTAAENAAVTADYQSSRTINVDPSVSGLFKVVNCCAHVNTEQKKGFMKNIFSIFIVTMIAFTMVGWTYAATPMGFSSSNITVSARVNVSCQEVQHGSFPSPLVIETQTPAEQSFPPNADELVRCTNGIVFTVKVTSANGSALDQVCTSGGVTNMALKSAGWPGDVINYTFYCSGDTDGNGLFIGAGYNASKALGIGIRVAAADAQVAIAHADYSDTVTLTITY